MSCTRKTSPCWRCRRCRSSWSTCRPTSTSCWRRTTSAGPPPIGIASWPSGRAATRPRPRRSDPARATDQHAPRMTDHGRAMLHLRQITKRFGSQTVLQGIDLDLRAGEFVSLLGPSGCGKTTLLRIVCGIETPELGQVLMQGQDITAWPASQRRFGVVFQSYALFPNLTAMENVRYGLSGLPRREAAERAAEMLALVGLPEQAGKFPSQLSAGQQQRVALARA